VALFYSLFLYIAQSIVICIAQIFSVNPFFFRLKPNTVHDELQWSCIYAYARCGQEQFKISSKSKILFSGIHMSIWVSNSPEFYAHSHFKSEGLFFLLNGKNVSPPKITVFLGTGAFFCYRVFDNSVQ
jgi:hypothetical protein